MRRSGHSSNSATPWKPDRRRRFPQAEDGSAEASKEPDRPTAPLRPRGLDGDATKCDPYLQRRLRGSPSSPPCVEHQILRRCGRRNRCCDLWPRRWHPSGMPMLLRIGFPAVSPSSTAGYRLESLRDEGRQESMAQVAPTRMPEASQQVAGGRAQRYHRLQIRRTRASRQGLSLNSRPSTLNFLTASSQSP